METLFVGFIVVGMASIKSLWLQMNIALWLIAHSAVFFTLLTGSFQTIHDLYDYYSVDLLHPLC